MLFLELKISSIDEKIIYEEKKMKRDLGIGDVVGESDEVAAREGRGGDDGEVAEGLREMNPSLN